MNELPDCANVLGLLLGEGQCSANQPSNTLPKRVVDPLNMGCLAALLADCPMTLGRKHADRGLLKVALADRTLAIDRGQRRP